MLCTSIGSTESTHTNVSSEATTLNVLHKSLPARHSARQGIAAKLVTTMRFNSTYIGLRAGTASSSSQVPAANTISLKTNPQKQSNEAGQRQLKTEDATKGRPRQVVAPQSGSCTVLSPALMKGDLPVLLTSRHPHTKHVMS